MPDIRVTSTHELSHNQSCISLTVRPREKSEILWRRLLSDSDMRADFYESTAFRRIGRMGTTAEVHKAVARLIPIYQADSGGCRVLWVCSKRDARVYRVMFRGSGVQFAILRGSLRKDNPYPPLVIDWGEQGGSDDEHICMISFDQ